MVSYCCEATDGKETHERAVLEVKVIELARTREALKRAKDDLAQSWLAARPLIDELEKLQSILSTTKNRVTTPNKVTSELEFELETANESIRLKQQEELKLRLELDETNRALHPAREEMEELELEKDEERRLRSDLQQALRLKKQSLQTLQLTLRAIKLESEAIGASATEAARYVTCSEADGTPLQLDREEYYVLTKRAEEETLLGDWRVSLSMEQILAAEKSRDSALRRLKELSEKKLKDSKTMDENIIANPEEDKSRVVPEIEVMDRGLTSPSEAEIISYASTQSSGRLHRRLTGCKTSARIKKPSVLVRIKSCLQEKVQTWLQ